MNERSTTRLAMIGADGLVTLLLSNLVIIGTCGASLLWNVGTVWNVARSAPVEIDPPDLLVVLGMRLQDNAVTAGYAQRLRRAAELFRVSGDATILILGGRTGGASISEAEQGRLFLIADGIPAARICIEDRSTHTLENLHYARALLEKRGDFPLALITSRDHLARSKALALGLNLRPVLCAAEECWSGGFVSAMQLIREGYFLHWYKIGKIWSQWTNNRRSLARIS
ncbi:MAG: YdcF family protein [Rhodospirillales bacterium]|nr:YdcF family protein [Rhodospirillales bacterium]